MFNSAPDSLPHLPPEDAVHDRTRTAGRYARGVAAAVAAVAALALAANAGPQSSEHHPGGGTGRVGEVSGSLTSAVRLDGSTWASRPGPR
jgi:hypothetical protein